MARAFLEDIPAGQLTAETICRMYRLVDAAKTDARFQKLVYGVVNRALPGRWKDYTAELAAIFAWAKGAVDYRRDPYQVELLQDVWATLDRKRADCDDYAILLGAAAEVLGAPVRFITVSTRADKEPSHVYVEAYAGGAWQAMDAIMPHSYVGWFPQEGITDRKVWDRAACGLGGTDDLGVEGLGKMDTLIVGPSRGARRILSVADRTEGPLPGGRDFPAPPPIAAHPYPGEAEWKISRSEIKSDFDPRAAWWGPLTAWAEDVRAMWPQQVAAEGAPMEEMAGLAGLEGFLDDALAIAKSVVGAVADGIIPGSKAAVGQAVDIGVGVWQAKQAKAPAPAPPAPVAALAPAAVVKAAAVPAGVIIALVAAVVLLGGGGKRRR